MCNIIISVEFMSKLDTFDKFSLHETIKSNLHE